MNFVAMLHLGSMGFAYSFTGMVLLLGQDVSTASTNSMYVGGAIGAVGFFVL